MFSNWQFRLLAVVLALICWYLVTGREKVEAWVEVPVELVKTSPDLVIRDGLKSKIDIRIRGPKAMVRSLEPKRLAYPLDLSGLEPGQNTVTFAPGDIPVPGALIVVEVNPPRMQLTVDRLVRKRVPVRPVWEAVLDQDYQLVSAVSRPATVELQGPEALLADMEDAPTRMLSVNATKPELVAFDAGLDLSPEVKADPEQVRVDLYFGVRTKPVWIKTSVRVAPEGLEGVGVTPAVVRLQIEAPVTELRRSGFRDGVSAVVVVPSGQEPGRQAMTYRIKLPPGCTLIKAVPEQVEVTLKKKK